MCKRSKVDDLSSVKQNLYLWPVSHNHKHISMECPQTLYFYGFFGQVSGVTCHDIQRYSLQGKLCLSRN